MGRGGEILGDVLLGARIRTEFLGLAMLAEQSV